jgi:hypothetical protein
MKIIQVVALFVLVAFVPWAVAGPFEVWGGCGEDGEYCAGVAVDLFRAREAVDAVRGVFVKDVSVYEERAVDSMTAQVPGQLYAGAGGVSDTPVVVSVEEIKASRLNPWGVVLCVCGGLVVLGGIALYAKGSDSGNSNDGTTVDANADNGGEVNIYVYSDPDQSTTTGAAAQ